MAEDLGRAPRARGWGSVAEPLPYQTKYRHKQVNRGSWISVGKTLLVVSGVVLLLITARLKELEDDSNKLRRRHWVEAALGL